MTQKALEIHYHHPSDRAEVCTLYHGRDTIDIKFDDVDPRSVFEHIRKYTKKIVLFNTTDGSKVLDLDVIPGNKTHPDLEVGNVDPQTGLFPCMRNPCWIKFRVRCFFVDLGAVDLRIDIEAGGDPRLRINEEDVEELQDLMRGDWPDSKDLGLLKSTDYQDNPYQDNPFIEALFEAKIQGREIEVRPHLFKDAEETAYRLGFRAKVPFTADRFPRFPAYNKKFIILKPGKDDSGTRAKLCFRQIPSSRMRNGPLESLSTDQILLPGDGRFGLRFVWLVALENLSAESAKDAWNIAIGSYLPTARASRLHPFLPTLGETWPDASWILLYEIQEIFNNARNLFWGRRHQTGDYLNLEIDNRFTAQDVRPDPDLQKKKKRYNFLFLVRGIALRPNERQKWDVSFSEIKTHRGTALRGQVAIYPSTIEPSSRPPEVLREMEEKPGLALGCKSWVRLDPAIVDPIAQRVRFGSLDLVFDQRQEQRSGDGKTTELAGSVHYALGQSGIHQYRVELRFPVSRVLPGGQDDLPRPYRVCDLERESPLIIADAVQENASSRGEFVLEIEDSSNTADPPKKVLSLKRFSDASDGIQSVLVIDREPFFAGLLELPSFQSITSGENNVVAFWTSGENAQPPRVWQLRSSQEHVPKKMILPPQGIGETMERYRNLEPGRRADFRLSSPAQIEFSSFFWRAYEPVPWNFRQIFGCLNLEECEAVIKELHYELLYGLDCSYMRPDGAEAFRLLEIMAILGHLRQCPEDPEWNVAARKSSAEAWREVRERSKRAHRQYLSRLAVFEPLRDQDLERNTRKAAVVRLGPAGHSCVIRRSGDGDLAHPITTRDEQCRADGDKPLCGGAPWGFESFNVYNAVQGTPRAMRSEISGFLLSGLGGWGRQVASFDNGLSTLYADSAMGRTYTYRLERLGRIAVWWHRARHVILYERTVVPSRQLGCFQNAHAGRPILRKVEEYVELLEFSRAYPDAPTIAGLAGKERQRATSFIHRCTFPENAKYRVLSFWGSDVGTDGWKVPIWIPDARPSDLYPKPVVKLSLASPTAGSQGEIDIEIDDPENLFFYTDTNAERDSTVETDSWPPIEGVDYVDFARPRVGEDFTSGRLRQTTADDPPVPLGFAPSTFHLARSAHSVDLRQGRVDLRSEKPEEARMGAVLETITLQRGPADSQREPPQIFATLKGHFARLGARLPDRGKPLEDELDSLRDEVKQLRQNVNVALEETRSSFPSTSSIIARFTTAEAELAAEYCGELDKLRTEISRDVEQGLRETTSLDAEAAAVLTGVLNAAQDDLKLLRRVPGVSSRTFGGCFDAARAGLRVAAERADSARTLVRLVLAGEADIERLRAELGRLRVAVREVERRVELAGERRPRLDLPNPAPWIIEEHLGEWKTLGALVDDGIETIAGDLEGSLLTEALSEIQERILDTVEERKATLLGPLQEARDALFEPVGELGREADAWLEAVQDDVEMIVASGAGDVRGLVVDLERKLEQGSGRLFEAVDGVAGRLDTKIREAVNKARGSIDPVRRFGERAAEAERQLEDRLDAFADAGANALDDLRREIERQRDTLLAEVRQWLPIPFDPPSGLRRQADAGLRLLRAFGKPPEVSGLRFERDAVAYVFDELDDEISLTPVIARAAQVSAVSDALKPLGVDLPVVRLGSRLIPRSLRDFDLSDILPSFAGLDLRDLFPGLKMPDADDTVKIRHGLDQVTRRPWMIADIVVKSDESANLFSAGPLSLRTIEPKFEGHVRVDGENPPRREATGLICATWELTIGGFLLVKINDTELSFDRNGDIRFRISPANIELPSVLTMLSDVLKAFGGEETGLSVRLLPTGVESVLSLPIPDIQVGTTGMTNLHIGASLSLSYTDPTAGAGADDGFNIGLSFFLGRREAPFALSLFILGGGGYVEATSRYFPATGRLRTDVALAVTASASLAIALGPIRGGVYIFFGITARFSSGGDAGGGLRIGVMLLIQGRVSVLGIVSADVTLLLEAEYNSTSGALVGRGLFSIRIKICWCFTLKVKQQVTYTVGGRRGRQGGLSMPRHRPAAVLADAGPYTGSRYLHEPHAVYRGVPDLDESVSKQISNHLEMLV